MPLLFVLFIYMFTDLSWQVTLGENEGGGTHCLLSSLSDKSIVADDVLEYVRRYAELRMIKIIEEPLQVRMGLLRVVAMITGSFFLLSLPLSPPLSLS